MKFLKTRQSGTKSLTQVPNLTAVDLCDRCPAAASTVAVMSGNRELLFCGHHTNKYRKALVEQGATLYSPEAKT